MGATTLAYDNKTENMKIACDKRITVILSGFKIFTSAKPLRRLTSFLFLSADVTEHLFSEYALKARACQC